MKNNFVQRIISIFFITPIFIFCLIKGGLYFNILIFFLFVICSYEILKLNLIHTKIILLSILFLFLFSFYNLRNFDEGLKIIFLLTFITWSSDIGGYVFGKLIGGKKINLISPNKTLSGFIGSILLVQINLVYIDYFKINLFDEIYVNIFFLILGAIIVIIGDLMFSYFKRLNKIKDYSNLIPGHGGILDRLDGFIILIIIFYMVKFFI